MKDNKFIPNKKNPWGNPEARIADKVFITFSGNVVASIERCTSFPRAAEQLVERFNAHDGLVEENERLEKQVANLRKLLDLYEGEE